MTMPADVIIRVENVDAGYDGVAILERISFEIRRGEVFGILGGSGCGKSTLMKHMIGLNRPIVGAVYIDGDDIVTADDDQLERIQRRFGVMYQSGALFGSMTLLENVRLPLEVYTDLPDDAIDLVAPLIPEVEAGDRGGREENEPDGEQVELRQQAHPHGRQAQRRSGVRRERRRTPGEEPHADGITSAPLALRAFPPRGSNSRLGRPGALM